MRICREPTWLILKPIPVLRSGVFFGVNQAPIPNHPKHTQHICRKPRDWAPRIWEGSDFFAWLKLLARNKFAVEAPYWYIAAIVSAMSLTNTILRWFQESMHGDDAGKVPLSQDPLFVLGHWRSGTTLLHEMLILDERFTAPTTHDCFMPGHFLLSEGFFKKHLRFLMPERRPMDNMPAGWERPQEDEFALCLLGAPSTYNDFAFPNRIAQNSKSLTLDLAPSERMLWKRTLRRFVGLLAVRDPRQLVLKSPPHTARVPELLELFPNAKFVHITRDPYVLFASTVNLWNSLARKHGLQTPRDPIGVEEKVFREFRVIYERWLCTRKLIPKGRLVEVRYEDLAADLAGEVKRVYDILELGGFENAKLKIDEYVANCRSYQRNEYQITEHQRARIRERWGDLIERLGYGEPNDR